MIVSIYSFIGIVPPCSLLRTSQPDLELPFTPLSFPIPSRKLQHLRCSPNVFIAWVPPLHSAHLRLATVSQPPERKEDHQRRSDADRSAVGISYGAFRLAPGIVSMTTPCFHV
ncbi:hypothetical protein Trydic_g5600 [Trypoxylus dichotomus]